MSDVGIHSPEGGLIPTEGHGAAAVARATTVEIPLSNSMRVTLEDASNGRLATLWNEAGDPLADANLPDAVSLGGTGHGALRAAVVLAAETFHRYAQMHWSKGTADGRSKAIANAELAERMQAALSADKQAGIAAGDEPNPPDAKATEVVVPREPTGHAVMAGTRVHDLYRGPEPSALSAPSRTSAKSGKP